MIRTVTASRSTWRMALFTGVALALVAASAMGTPGGGHGGAHPGGGHSGQAHSGHSAFAAGAGSGHAWTTVPGHGWHGRPQRAGVLPPPWAWLPAYGWTGAAWAGSYDPWWWYPPVPFYDVSPSEVPDATPQAPLAEPVPYRFFCPTNSTFYPEVSTCPVPWLRVLPNQ